MFEEAKGRDPVLKGLNPFLLDVTKDDQIDIAKNMIEVAEPKGIYCLINNAVGRSALFR